MLCYLQKKSGAKLKLAKELSDMVTLIQSIHFKGFEQTINHGKAAYLDVVFGNNFALGQSPVQPLVTARRCNERASRDSITSQLK